MSKDIVTIDETASALAASRVMLEKKVDYLIVLEKAQPAGIVTERDLVLKVMAKGENPSETRISKCMTTPIVTTDPDATIEEAVKTMAEHGIRRLPVIRDTIIYGIFKVRIWQRTSTSMKTSLPERSSFPSGRSSEVNHNTPSPSQ